MIMQAKRGKTNAQKFEEVFGVRIGCDRNKPEYIMIFDSSTGERIMSYDWFNRKYKESAQEN